MFEFGKCRDLVFRPNNMHMDYSDLYNTMYSKCIITHSHILELFIYCSSVGVHTRTYGYGD